ncbi:hypothetical protein ACOZ4Y_08135 [Komagataeibacter rhaeticus]|uniref:Uncharacterized protein n=1 Tax=Komagataeibacter rhaeticus TaxID=215221 RepID=A0A858JND6_9PROT|nr:hypothetical protein [Komagataeibacter rhaeticus]MBL7239689.1 hypothetical protein [Komagataeibacter rhaeticus]MDT8870263.1 hypothetical protein [Komagataeibacter rhaeticus]QIP36419.1 hypothetical protein GWK63_13905 [Komagataeibacter rhaeticus]QOC46188.1 hypothetical protein ICJ78_13965 [Komagataeibacter rhaeticus]WPP21197.1 hypothetical protein SCD25_12315 [Komagataeibacter rhaeticus]
MSTSTDILRHSVCRSILSPFESWVRRSLRERFTMVSNENLPPEILLQFEDAHEAGQGPPAQQARTARG